LADGVVDRPGQLQRRIVGGARRAGDIGAGLGEGDRDRASYAAARTGHQGDPIAQLHRGVF
jgi:hypothetical protein